MKRLLRISLDLLLVSVLPIAMWLVLGIIVRPEIANVFSLTYPLQFVFNIFIAIFGVGPNITARKLKDKNIVSTNLMVGMFVVVMFVATVCLNVDWYIELMSLEPEIYRDFCTYAIIWIGLVCIISIISQKLYYVGKNKASNIMNLILSLSNFILIVGLNLIMETRSAINLTLVVDVLIVLFFLLRNFEKHKFSLKLFQNIKNTSFTLIEQSCNSLTYGVGFANSFSYGKAFIDAINFETLTTDAQWDALEAVGVAAKIDFTENKFRLRKTLKNAYKLVAILLGTVAIMNVGLYWYYRPELWILLIILGIQVIDMLMTPIIMCYWSYMQIIDNKPKHNVMLFGIRTIRAVCSFIPTGFCTYIGQLLSMLARYIYAKVECRNVKVFQLNRFSKRLRGR